MIRQENDGVIKVSGTGFSDRLLLLVIIHYVYTLRTDYRTFLSIRPKNMIHLALISSVLVEQGVKRRCRQGCHTDWKTWKIKMVMEKSSNMNNWPKVNELHSKNFTNFASEFNQVCMFFANIKHW